VRKVLRDRGPYRELEEHLLRISRALCVRRETDALRGLAVWSRGGCRYNRAMYIYIYICGEYMYIYIYILVYIYGEYMYIYI
jgi:hypothetical protein